MAAQTTSCVQIRVSGRVMSDYLRRGVFPEFHPTNSAARVTANAWHVFDNVPRQIVKQVLTDAWEQAHTNRGTSGRGLTIAYSAFARKLRYRLGLSWRTDPPLRDVDFGAYATGQVAVATLLRRLGIPCHS